MSSRTRRSYVTVAEAAELLDLHMESVRRMIRDGRLRATRNSSGRGGGGYRIPTEEIERIAPHVASSITHLGSGETPLLHRARGKYFLRSGLREQARAAYEAALEASQELDDDLGQAKALYKLGQIALRSGEIPSAANYYAEAQLRYERLGDPENLAAVLLAQADLELESDPVQLRDAERIYARVAVSAGLSSRSAAERGLGRIARSRKNWKVARKHLETAIDLAVRSGDLPAQANALRSFGLLLAEIGEYSQAATTLRSALNIYKGFGFAYREDAVRRDLAGLEAAAQSQNTT
jgi:excisionase family DNA binding protein